MATMSSSPRPLADLETKGAATILAPAPTAPTPDTATVTPEGVVELIAAVTGIQDDAGDGAAWRPVAEGRPRWLAAPAYLGCCRRRRDALALPPS